ncbi:MAG: hypothetical protein LQ347_003615 [Umbilicaria vellea]|nr:MAG: hypothetical protein LQ347_003615 [Umbilicaria vellea]
MAKAKRQLIPETKTKNIKTYVSTSAIFKKSGSRQLIVPATKRESRYQAQYNHQSVNGIVPCSLKKHAKPPVHPLSTAFNERIELSREHIHANAAALTESVHHSLADRLASASAQPDKLIKAGIALKEEMLQPLDDDQLQFASADGVTKAKVLFGDCMQSFRKTVIREEKALAVLWKEWTEVQQELEDFAKEMLGPDGLKQFRNSAGNALGGQCGEQQKKLTEDVELDKKRLEEEVEKTTQQAMQKMLASEKEMDFLQRKQRKGILSMWEAQL